MAGHHKWSNVKRLNGALDAKRGKLFSKLAKEITLAAKAGSELPNGSPLFRNAARAARAADANVEATNHHHFIITSHNQLPTVGDSPMRAGLEPDSMKLTYLPENTVPDTDEDSAAQFLRPSDALDDNDDVQNVDANADNSEILLVSIGG